MLALVEKVETNDFDGALDELEVRKNELAESDEILKNQNVVDETTEEEAAEEETAEDLIDEEDATDLVQDEEEEADIEELESDELFDEVEEAGEQDEDLTNLRPTQRAQTISFKNLLKKTTVRVYWVNFQKKLTLYRTLKPG